MSIEYIDITINEDDLETFKRVVYNNECFNWTYETNEGQYVTVNFMPEDEAEQREK